MSDLSPLLHRLDTLLYWAVDQVHQHHKRQPGTDPFRGLYIDHTKITHLLTYPTGTSPFQVTPPTTTEPLPQKSFAARFFSNNTPAPPPPTAVSITDLLPLVTEHPRFDWLQHTFNLNHIECDIILLALAPELDNRYELIYAYLQDNVNHRRPTIDLLLSLLMTNGDAKWEGFPHFAEDAPLLKHQLLHLTTTLPHTPRPTHFVHLDPQIVNFLLNHNTLDQRLHPFCRLLTPTTTIESPHTDLNDLLIRFWGNNIPLRLYFHGPNTTNKYHTAEAMATAVSAPLLIVNITQATQQPTPLETLLPLIFREAGFRNALLFIENIPDETIYQHLIHNLMRDSGVTIISRNDRPLPGPTPTDFIYIDFPALTFEQRRHTWQTQLNRYHIHLSPPDLDLLASRFRLNHTQITTTVATTISHAQRQTNVDNPAENQLGLPQLIDHARHQAGHELGQLAQKITPLYQWDDIILPEDSLDQLHEICQRIMHQHHVFHEWGFDKKLSLGKGINALFAGPSGTGKTMAAEIIANELKLDLYRIDLSGVVSKYIGETEKNLSRIFDAAHNANAILFFDEADALFGKRSEVRDSHDRYANIEISYLLQKMEAYEGIAILATNLRQNLDDAFTRRMTFTIHFPMPTPQNRERIWHVIWPQATPLAADIDFTLLAQRFNLAGGNIKNVALAAAFYAANNGRIVHMSHIMKAIKREYQKMGKKLSDAALQLEAS